MSEADKMFEELFYEKTCDDDKLIDYEYTKRIMGDSLYVRITFYKIAKLVRVTGRYDMPSSFNMAELKAINQKCKELGWLDD